MKNVIAIVCAAAALQWPLAAQSKLPPSAQRTFSDPSTYAPDLSERLTTSELRDVVPRYTADRQLLLRFYSVPGSLTRLDAQRGFADGWIKALDKLDFAKLPQEGRVDYILLRNRIRADREQVDVEAKQLSGITAFAPFGQDIASLQEARQRTQFVTPDAAVQAIAALTARVKDTLSAAAAGALQVPEAAAADTVAYLDGLRGSLPNGSTSITATIRRSQPGRPSRSRS